MRIDLKTVGAKNGVSKYRATVYRSEHKGLIQFNGTVKVAQHEELTYVRRIKPKKGFEKKLEDFAFVKQLSEIVIKHHKNQKDEKVSG